MENRKIIGRLDEITSLAPCQTGAVRKGTCQTEAKLGQFDRVPVELPQFDK
jgi:hypothetical protein